MANNNKRGISLWANEKRCNQIAIYYTLFNHSKYNMNNEQNLSQIRKLFPEMTSVGYFVWMCSVVAMIRLILTFMFPNQYSLKLIISNLKTKSDWHEWVEWVIKIRMDIWKRKIEIIIIIIICKISHKNQLAVRISQWCVCKLILW